MLPNKIKFNKKTILRFWPFLAFFLAKQKKMLQKNYFLILALLAKNSQKTAKLQPENSQQTAKIDHKCRKMAKFKPFDEIF